VTQFENQLLKCGDNIMIINDCDIRYNNILQTKVHQAVQFICHCFPQKPSGNYCTDLDDCAIGVSVVWHLLMDITNQTLQLTYRLTVSHLNSVS
jgi:hypothetical protein